METPKPLSLEKRREVLTTELREANRQVQSFKEQIVSLENKELADRSLINSFKGYTTLRDDGQDFVGRLRPKNDDGVYKSEISVAKRVFDIFASKRLSSHKSDMGHLRRELVQLEKRKTRILEELLTIGAAVPVESAGVAELTETVDKTGAPLSDADRLKALEVQAGTLRKKIEYKKTGVGTYHLHLC